ncbi:MAG: hypothetical protein OXK75_06670, partial [Gammaproteobacteria bacterium]|nr:hypothetical protein [Gammaproteobacteria bacterium]
MQGLHVQGQTRQEEGEEKTDMEIRVPRQGIPGGAAPAADQGVPGLQGVREEAAGRVRDKEAEDQKITKIDPRLPARDAGARRGQVPLPRRHGVPEQLAETACRLHERPSRYRIRLRTKKSSLKVWHARLGSGIFGHDGLG